MNLIYFQRILFLLFILGFINLDFQANSDPKKNKKEVIIIHNDNIARSEKEALIILPGLGDSKKGRKHQKEFFENIGYDLFIPDYIARGSFEGTIKKFTNFYTDQQIDQYKKVHVFSYILGSWTINSFINREGIKNIKTIVYDRSPLQERAPLVIVDRIPLIGRIVSGNVLKDFSKISYPPIKNEELNIGIIVESKATPLIRKFKKRTMSYGSIDWNYLDSQQSYDELIYTRLNHDEMYYSFNEIGDEIIEFIKFSKFKKDAKYSPYDWDPFEKYKQ